MVVFNDIGMAGVFAGGSFGGTCYARLLLHGAEYYEWYEDFFHRDAAVLEGGVVVLYVLVVVVGIGKEIVFTCEDVGRGDVAAWHKDF